VIEGFTVERNYRPIRARKRKWTAQTRQNREGSRNQTSSIPREVPQEASSNQFVDEQEVEELKIANVGAPISILKNAYSWARY
jgi:hypothetical protein